MKLIRNDKNQYGVFGNMTQDDGTQVAATLEHAYQQPDNSWSSKIPDGSYTCVRGQHQLHGMAHPFITFEITNVPNCTNILIHMGNFDKDSEGCVLVGASRSGNMVVNSVVTFNAFMASMAGIDSFQLDVSTASADPGLPPMPSDQDIEDDLKSHE